MTLVEVLSQLIDRRSGAGGGFPEHQHPRIVRSREADLAVLRGNAIEGRIESQRDRAAFRLLRIGSGTGEDRNQVIVHRGRRAAKPCQAGSRTGEHRA